MEIIKKIAAKAADNFNAPGVSIAFFGDSVTQGCFELFMESAEKYETVFDKNNAYHAHLAKIFSVIFPTVPINMINAGVSGDNACHALTRLDRDVIKYNPDLTVVAFCLNDSNRKEAGLEDYANALEEIFRKLKEAGSEIIFMTPNMMNTNVSPFIENDLIRATAEKIMKQQEDGILDMYVNKAKEVCEKNNIRVCDCHSKWKLLEKNGANITELLANKLNHPTREMNWLFAVSLFETMLS